jgi:hypothetical protein
LKLKSEQMPPEKAAALRAAVANDERAAQPAPPLSERPIARSAPRRQATPTRPPIEECTVGWWRGYVKSQFTAVGADGALIASSPYFRWRRADAPPEAPPATDALSELVRQLQLDGWTVTGRQKEWFELRFARDRNRHPQPEKQGRPSSFTGGRDASRQR